MTTRVLSIATPALVKTRFHLPRRNDEDGVRAAAYAAKGQTMPARYSTRSVRALTAGMIAVAGVAIAGQPAPPPLAFPQGYRSWQHVRTIVVGPTHKTFDKRGGLHHYYANDKAVEGYRTGAFPDGAIIVDEGVWGKDGEGEAKGILFEGDRRALNVMTKNGAAFKDTGGWGYEHYDGQDTSGRLTNAQRAQCAECHANAERDHVYTKIRP